MKKISTTILNGNNVKKVIACCGAILLMLTISSCKTYLGYREYTEKTELDDREITSVVVDYDIKLKNNQFEITEAKSIDYTQKIQVDQCEEWIYRKTLVGDIIGHAMVYPIQIMLSPLVIAARDTTIEYISNEYTYTAGRRVWNFFNLFGSLVNGKASEIDGLEQNIIKSEIVSVDRNKNESQVMTEAIDMIAIVEGKKHSVKSDISMYELCELVFEDPQPNQQKQVTISIQNSKAEFTLDSNNLFKWASAIETSNDVSYLFEIFYNKSATKYDLSLAIKQLEKLSNEQLNAAIALTKIYSPSFEPLKKVDIAEDVRQFKFSKYQTMVEEKEEELRLAEEKRLAEEQRIAEELRIAEEKRIAEQKKQEAERLAEEKRLSEMQQLAESPKENNNDQNHFQSANIMLASSNNNDSTDNSYTSETTHNATSSYSNSSADSSNDDYESNNSYDYSSDYTTVTPKKEFKISLFKVILVFIIWGIVGIILSCCGQMYLFQNTGDVILSLVLAFILLLTFFCSNPYDFPTLSKVAITVRWLIIIAFIPLSYFSNTDKWWAVFFVYPAKIILGLLAAFGIFSIIAKIFDSEKKLAILPVLIFAVLGFVAIKLIDLTTDDGVDFDFD